MAEYRIEVVVSPNRAIAEAARFGAAMETLEKRANRTRDSIAQAFRPPPTAALGSIAAPYLKASAAADHFSQVVLETSRKARGGIDDAAISWDGWTSKTNQAGVTISKTGGLIRGAMAAAPYVAAAAAVASLADSYTNLQNRLISVTSTETEARDLSEDLFGVAQRTRSEWGAVTEVFVRTTGALKGLGYSQSEVIDFTETLSKAVKISGASATEANAAMIQLSQGLASGTLRGDELRSVLEQLPTVADVIAKQLGVTRGELRTLGEEGKISTSDIIKAFQNAKSEIDAGFGRTVPTIGEQFTKLKNILVKAVGDMMPLLGPIIENMGRLVSVIGEVLGAVGKVAGVIAETQQEIGAALGLVNTNTANTATEIRVLAKEFQGFTLLGVDMGEALNDAATEVESLDEYIRTAAEGGNGLAQTFRNVTDAVFIYAGALEMLRAREEEVRNVNELLAGSTGVLAVSFAEAAKAGAKKIVEDLREYKRAQEEAARAMDAAKASFLSLYEAQNPVIAANNEIARTQQLVNKIVGAYPALAEQGISIMAKMREQLASQLDPLDAYLDNIREEAALLTLSGDARQHAIDLLAFENSMRQAGVEITLAGIAAFEYELALRNQAQADSDARDANAAALGSSATDLFGAVDAGQNAARSSSGTSTAARAAQEEASAVADAWAGAFKTMEDALVGFVTTGKLDFHALTQSILADITRILIKQALVAAFGGGGSAGGAGGVEQAGVSALSGLLGFATGGSFTVGGNGGTDTTPVMFRATRGERVIVQTPAQQAAAAQPMMSAPPVVHNNVVFDSRQLLGVLESPGGRRALNEAVRVNASAFKAALR